MEKVYVVLRGFDYEGENTEGVFSTRPAAKKMADTIRDDHCYAVIERWSINGKCEKRDLYR